MNITGISNNSIKAGLRIGNSIAQPMANAFNYHQQMEYANQKTQYEVATKKFMNDSMLALENNPLQLDDNDKANKLSILDKYESWWNEKSSEFYETQSGNLTNDAARAEFDRYYQVFSENGRGSILEWANSEEKARAKVTALDNIQDAMESGDYSGARTYIGNASEGGILSSAEQQQWLNDIEELEIYDGIKFDIAGMSDRQAVYNHINAQPITDTMKNQLLGDWDARETAKQKAEKEAKAQRRESQMQVFQELVIGGKIGNTDHLYELIHNNGKDLEASDHRTLNSLLNAYLRDIEEDNIQDKNKDNTGDNYKAFLETLLINPNVERDLYEEALADGLDSGQLDAGDYMIWHNKADSPNSPHLNRPEIKYAIEQINAAASGKEPLISGREAMQLQEEFWNYVYGNSWKEEGPLRDTDVSDSDIERFITNRLQPLKVKKIGETLFKLNAFGKPALIDNNTLSNEEKFEQAIAEGKIQGLIIPERMNRALNMQNVLTEEQLQEVFTDGRAYDELTDREKQIVDVNVKYIDLVNAQKTFITDRLGGFDSIEIDITGTPIFQRGVNQYRVSVKEKNEVIEKYHPGTGLWTVEE